MEWPGARVALGPKQPCNRRVSRVLRGRSHHSPGTGGVKDRGIHAAKINRLIALPRRTQGLDDTRGRQRSALEGR
jgi:hypothetical protein